MSAFRLNRAEIRAAAEAAATAEASRSAGASSSSSASSAPPPRRSTRGTKRRATASPADPNAGDDQDYELEAEVAFNDEMELSDSSGEEMERSERGELDFSKLPCKPDHEQRPIWAIYLPSAEIGYVFLETFSNIYRQAYDFLIAIAEPVSRPERIHEYKITKYSLYAATSLGLRCDDILSGLDRFSKVVLDPALVDFIRESTLRCGKIKLVLKHNRYFLESIFPETLNELIRTDTRITNAAIDPKESAKTGNVGVYDATTRKLWVNPTREEREDLVIPGTAHGDRVDQRAAMGIEDPSSGASPEDGAGASSSAAARPAQQKILAFEVQSDKIGSVRQACSELEFPLLEEYDFRRDQLTPDLPITLKPSTQIRSYQEKSLSKMFGNGRARSGIIVLPCGAGKTLVGITAMSTIRKSCIVLCTSTVAVHQWRHQIKLWSQLSDKHIRILTSSQKDEMLGHNEGTVLITTYSMASFNRKRSREAQRVMDFVHSHPWGLVILDEVQVVPANTFRLATQKMHSHCKLGLTATLVREDNRIDDLHFLIGPKLYEANWLTLQEAGHIATVRCIEVWCPMTAEFYNAYLEEPSNERRQLLSYLNPNKFRTAQYLINYHESRGDKVLVFSDNIFTLTTYSRSLGHHHIHGGTSDGERRRLLEQFQTNPKFNCLFISKVGDNSIDLPDVNVIIQVSSHYASRRQEAQRMGRILRPKPRTSSRFNAFFYTLLSKDTKEMHYGARRKRFLVDQGYAYDVVPDFGHMIADDPTLVLRRREDQLRLLGKVRSSSKSDAATEQIDADQVVSSWTARAADAGRRRIHAEVVSSDAGGSLNVSGSLGGSADPAGNSLLDSITGAGGVVYGEFSSGQRASSGRRRVSRPRSTPGVARNSLFVRRQKEKQQRLKKKRRDRS